MNSDLLVLAERWNIAAPGANTDILATSFECPVSGILLISVVLATESVLNIIESDGTTSFTIGVNSSVALTAGDGNFFSFGATRGHTYNFQVETNGIIRKLQVILDKAG